MKYNIEKTNKFAKQYAKVLKQKEFKEEEFIELLDNAIKNINSKTKLDLKRISKKIYLGKNN